MIYTRNPKSKLRFCELILYFIVGFLLCPLSLNIFAQEKKSGIVPGRVIVKFKYDEIELPQGETRAEIGRVSFRSATLNRVLQRFKINHFARIVPAAVKGDTLRVLAKGAIVKLADFSQIHLLSFPEDISVNSVVAALQELDQVVYAEPDQFLVYDADPPNDEFFDDQWHLQQSNDIDIDAPEAWHLSKGDGIKIAIIDLGVRVTHEDFVGKIAPGGETTITVVSGNPNHGTKVAGVAGAATNNTVGVAGVGYNAKIIPYDNKNILSESANDINAAVAAGADIINMSFHNITYSQTFRDALLNAFSQGVTLIATSGNNSESTFPYTGFPHAFDGLVTTVGSTNRQDNFRTENSNWGFFVDVVAPGFQIKTTDGDHDADYASPTGTSYAAPIVSGIAALLRAFEPLLEDRDIERIIELSAEKVDAQEFPYDSNGWNNHLGHGRVNANDALELVAANDIRHWTASGGSINSISSIQTWTFGTTPYTGKRYHVIKTNVTFPETFSSPPEVWGRVVGTVGYLPNNQNYSIPWCAAIIVSEVDANLETYVYQLWDLAGNYLGFFPTTPANVQFAYTAFGTLGSPPPQPPAPPQNLVITNPGAVGQSPHFTWDSISGATSYNIYRRVSFQQQWVLFGSTTSTSFTDFMLEILDPSDPDADEFFYHVKAVNSVGESGPSNSAAVWGLGVFKSINDELTTLPNKFELQQNYPNPFNPTTVLRYSIPKSGYVELVIVNLLGQPVRSLIAKSQSTGWYNIIWDGRNDQGQTVGSGIYLYRLAVKPEDGSTQFTQIRKMSLLR